MWWRKPFQFCPHVCREDWFWWPAWFQDFLLRSLTTSQIWNQWSVEDFWFWSWAFTYHSFCGLLWKTRRRTRNLWHQLKPSNFMGWVQNGWSIFSESKFKNIFFFFKIGLQWRSWRNWTPKGTQYSKPNTRSVCQQFFCLLTYFTFVVQNLISM